MYVPPPSRLNAELLIAAAAPSVHIHIQRGLDSDGLVSIRFVCMLCM